MRIRGIALPAGEPVECWTDGGRLTFTRQPGADTVIDGGFLLPGLVDAHSHPGRPPGLGDPLDEAKLRADARAHAEAGVALLRALGSPDRPLPARFRAGTPRILDAGIPLGVPGQFPPGAGRVVPAADLPAAAVQNCRDAGGTWCKLYADWIFDADALARPSLAPPETLAEAVRQVHAAGGRVAVHATHPDACRAVVQAGADSLEHGLWLDAGLLPQMARQGTALTPTITVWARQLGAIEAEPEPVRSWFLDGLRRLPHLTAQAHDAGVTVLAGTDSEPHGRIADEIRSLARGVPADVALGAGSWTARAYFGLPGLAEGAPADIVGYAEDPRQNLAVLDHPSRIVIGGRLVR
ncbi:MAG: amidohydrolase family protein [Streptosporangiaceae bacterium]|nr:amidohydrolase family protein [Streptosporangiaceae bacterium]